MLFVFLCICSLFPLFFDLTNDGLAYLFMKSGNPGRSGVLAQDLVLLTFPNFPSQAFFAQRLILRVKLLGSKRFFPIYLPRYLSVYHL